MRHQNGWACFEDYVARPCNVGVFRDIGEVLIVRILVFWCYIGGGGGACFWEDPFLGWCEP